MGRPQKKFSEEQRLEIAAALKRSKDAQEQKRLLILENRGQGKPIEEIMQVTRSSRSHVTHTISKYLSGGLVEMLKKKRTGHRRNMEYEEEQDLLESFRKDSQSGKMLVVSDIQKAYEEKLGRTVHNSVIYRMLKRHNWRKVMPRGKHPKKADAQTIEAFKKTY